ncbi:MAG: Asp-tRNA(Asn)/Glu-tRNA(Gln) amidotransferase subunit GatB [Oscillospiraceae bacterium]|nr:Asp-tRNA(Asn)/Glu-tRNA(Gln) amidotransferase subunit GatB [Oscillospiraceae bacterium]
MNYEAIIGLEIHAELKTRTKLFCSCKNEFGGEPNSRICPVCTGQPGTLPYVNGEAVRLALRACLAFGCEINRTSKQCRKHYFYPDLPKGYQISQRETPLGINGCFEFLSDGQVKCVGIEQIHLEEDAGKLVHRSDGKTAIDYNRAGVPLIEIVTSPELHSAQEVRDFLESVRLRLLRTGVSDCRMEQGSLRCDVNVSLRRAGEAVLNDRVEMKNINTFSGAARAVEHEIERQCKILDSGEAVLAETRKWDDEKRESRLMRTKETAVDYKFMPEPDIPAYVIDEKALTEAGYDIPESDVHRNIRYEKAGISRNDRERLIADVDMSDFFDGCISSSQNASECAKLIVGDVASLLTRENVTLSQSHLTPGMIVEIADLIVSGSLGRGNAKVILSKLLKNGGSVASAAAELMSIDDDAVIEESVKVIIADNPKAVADYKKGKENAVTYLTGQCMRSLRGRANAERLKTILLNELKGEN